MFCIFFFTWLPDVLVTRQIKMSRPSADIPNNVQQKYVGDASCVLSHAKDFHSRPWSLIYKGASASTTDRSAS